MSRLRIAAATPLIAVILGTAGANAQPVDEPPGDEPASEQPDSATDQPDADAPPAPDPLPDPESEPELTDPAPADPPGDEIPLEGEAGFARATSVFKTSIYGYVDVQWRELAFTTGLPAMKEERFPVEFRNTRGGGWLNLNVMLQGDVAQKFRWFINLGVTKAADIADGDSNIEVRNGWVETPLYRDLLVLRGGKTYRRFGLYNEILDAAPTFPGVEAPAFLVEGQTLLTRTTNVMVHGTKLLDENRLQYALHTGTDERSDGGLPIGGDLRFHYGELLTVGSSFYVGPDATRTRAVGEGEPIGGVKNWIAEDDYYVVGGYGQLNLGKLLVQVEGWFGRHDAQRDPAQVLAFADVAELNMRRRQRFFNGVDMPAEGDVNIDADYSVKTAWTRLAYEFGLGAAGAITPYVHLDYYSDPEVIPGGRFGGNEAGLADDGVFFRTVLGFVYRPVPPVAVKAEINPHIQTVAGETATFSPVQVSLSYFWHLDL